MSPNRTMDKEMWYIYKIEYYYIIENKDMINFAGKWKGPEKMILSEIPQAPKDTQGM